MPHCGGEPPALPCFALLCYGVRVNTFIDKALTFSVLYTFIVEAGCICYNEKMHYLWMQIGILEQKKGMPHKEKNG